MRKSVEPELAGSAEDLESDVEAHIVRETDDEGRERMSQYLKSIAKGGYQLKRTSEPTQTT